MFKIYLYGQRQMICMDKFTSMRAGSLYHTYFYLYIWFIEYGSA